MKLVRFSAKLRFQDRAECGNKRERKCSDSGHYVPSATPKGSASAHTLFGPIFDQSVLQHQLADLLEFKNENKMKINYKKTKILPFNTSKKYDFLPQLHFPDNDPLKVIYETRLLCVILSSNLTWTAV
jgi:hypothetical protein